MFRRLFKNITAVGLALTMTVGSLLGCKSKELTTVTLSVWGAKADREMLEQMIDGFKTAYAGEAVFNITLSIEEESTCKDTVINNIDNAADIFAFADDQLGALYNANALLKITSNTDSIIESNGGRDSAAIESASVNGELYAYPSTASNGYFMYYNSAYFGSEDVKSFDAMLDIAERYGKKIAMDFGSGWYIYSFFKGAGLDVWVNKDGITNTCNWNSTTSDITGLEVAEAMLAIAERDGFKNCSDEDFIKGIQNGSIIAGVNGAWNSTKVEAAWGDNYEAVKLPEYTVAGRSVQMNSFMGYKLIGVNATTDDPEWAMKLAEWLTNEDNQIKRFETKGEAPTNINAASKTEVLKSKAIAALTWQSEYGHIQRVGESFWTPAYSFGMQVAAGNRDGRKLQELLDIMVNEIEKK